MTTHPGQIEHDLIVSRVLRHARSHAEKEALIAGEARITYGELARRFSSVAQQWRSEGLQSGDIVLLAAESTPSFAYAYLAAHLLGLRVVPIDPSAPPQRIIDIADRIRPKAIYVPKSTNCDELDCRPLIDLEDASRAHTDVSWTEDLPLPSPDDIADIIFTTGTTGAPKGVLLSHANICAAADSINSFIGNSAADREVIPLPLSHSFGLGRLRCVFSTGGTLILVNGFMFTDMIFEAMSVEQATGFSFVPAGAAVLFRQAEDRLGDFSEQLSYVEIGSAPMPLENKQRLMRLLPKTRLCMHYGLTEASRSAFIEFHSDREHLDTIGLPSPGVELRIVDTNNQPAPAGESGELRVRGAHVMQGYWHDKRETGLALRDGWLNTGDVGSKDANGYVRLLGRKKEMINVGGRKVVPLEVENVLNEHSAILECACIGTTDPQGISGEVVRACLVASGNEKPSPRDFAQFLKGKLENYKIPVQYHWVESIPKTSSGKLQRQSLPR